MSKLFRQIISESNFREGFTTFKEFNNDGRIEIHSKVDICKNDFKDLMNISIEFAKTGKIVQILPKLHYKDVRYKDIFGSLIGTKFEGKCPDLKIDNYFYEHEEFISNNPKTNFSNMLRRGLKQSSRIVIEECGVTFAHIKRTCIQRIKNGHLIDEVWVMTRNKIELVFKSKASKSYTL